MQIYFLKGDAESFWRRCEEAIFIGLVLQGLQVQRIVMSWEFMDFMEIYFHQWLNEMSNGHKG